MAKGHFSFPLHQLKIHIVSNDPHYLKVLRSNLSFSHRDLPAARKGIRKKIVLEFEHKRGMKLVHGHSDTTHSLYDMPHLGIFRNIDYKRNRILVRVKRKGLIPESWMYHYCFLRPLFLFLRKFGMVFVHASLVAKGGLGTLIMGSAGSGKSTLSIAFLRDGFSYFCDEHPILTLKGNRVFGLSFVNRIGIPRISMNNFPELECYSQWNPIVKKFFVNPDDIAEGDLGSQCRINRIIFPEFSKTGKLKIKKLTPLELFKKLLKDDYLVPDRRTFNPYEWRLGLKHFAIIGSLANKVKGFSVRYSPSQIPFLPKILSEFRS